MSKYQMKPNEEWLRYMAEQEDKCISVACGVPIEDSTEYEINIKDNIIQEKLDVILELQSRIDHLISIYRRDVDSGRHHVVDMFDKNHHTYSPPNDPDKRYRETGNVFTRMPSYVDRHGEDE